MDTRTKRIWLACGVVVFALAIFTVGAFGSITSATSEGKVVWRVEITRSFTPAQINQPGWNERASALHSALISEVRARGATVEAKQKARPDGGVDYIFSLSGAGSLQQFKQVVFADIEPIGGLLDGPISLTLTGDISQGETVPLTLEANWTTGYQWAITQIDQAVLRQSGSSEFKSDSSLLDAPGNQIVRVQGAASGNASIVMAYRRPWESDVEPTRKITIGASRLSAIADLSNPAMPEERRPESQPQEKSLALAPADLPASFDWRTTGKVTAVRDQGQCGSSWAFGTVAPFESNLLIKQSLTTDLSEQYLISCNHDGWSCDGGWWAHDYHIWKYFAPQTQAGAVLESDDPYTASNGSCTVAYNHPYQLGHWAYVGNGSSVPTVDAIKNAIYTYGPVVAAVCAGSRWSSYSSGVYTRNESSTCSGAVNHAVTIVGWNDAQQYWILKNSWGPSWGESGYMRMRWNISNIGYAASYVDDTVVAPPANDDFDAPVVVGSLPYTTDENTAPATTTSDDPNFTCGLDEKHDPELINGASGSKYTTVWWRYTPSQSEYLAADTVGSGYDTVLAVWRGSRGSLTSVGCNDDANSTLQSQVPVLMIQGQTYYIEAASYSAGGGQLVLNASATPTTVCTAAVSGNWSAPATWGCGHVPGPGEAVAIPAGLTVTLDQDIELDSALAVEGTLIPNGKTVTLTGDQTQPFTGDPLTFYNLVVNKTNATDAVTIGGNLEVTGKLTITRGKLVSASDYEDIEIGEDGELELTSDITVGGDFTNSGTLTTNGYGVTFDGAKEQNLTLNVLTWFDDLTVSVGTTLIEAASDDNAYVQGTLTNNGVIRKTQAIDAEGLYNYGLAGEYNGADLETDVTTDDFASITVERRDQNHAGRTGSAPPGDGVGWGIYWTITPVGTGTVDLTLPHNLADDTKASACRFVSGTTWNCGRTSSTANSVTRANVSSFSAWAVGNDAPLAAPLAALDAVAAPGRVTVRWETASEVDTLGFNLYRAAAAGGVWAKLNAAMLPSQAPDSPSGYSYAYDDPTVARGGVYRYRLAAVGLDGQEVPLDTVQVIVPYWLWLPVTVVR